MEYINPWEKSIKPVGFRAIFWVLDGQSFKCCLYKDFRHYRDAETFIREHYRTLYKEGIRSPRQSIYEIIYFKIKNIRRMMYQGQ